MDIYARLKDDHGKQRGLAAAILKTEGDSAERRRLFQAFRTELKAHANAEEQTLYSDLLAIPDLQEQARHSVSEHEEAEALLEKLEETDMSTGGWLIRFKSLWEEVEHHLDEEERDVFPRARKHLDTKRAEALGAAFARRKAEEVEEA